MSVAHAVIESRDPFTGEVVYTGSAADVDRALDEACAGAERWAATPVPARAAALRAFAERVDADAAALADLLVREVGKRRTDAEGEVAWTALSARWYAGHPPGEERAGGATVHRRPLGVVAAITPWNVPLITPAWKWLPALMAGNAVVWKPSERATAMAEAAREHLVAAGVDPGAIVLVPGGPETAAALAADERVAAIHFTGSERAGRSLAGAAAPRLARCALEMSGSNPAIVFADADLEHAADCIVACGTALAGQKCTATRRVLAERPVHDALLERLTTRIAALRVGDPRDGRTDVGPLIGPAERERAEAVLEASLAAGATLAARAHAGGHPSFFGPALLTALAPEDPLRREELFAPVMTLEAFDADEEAWARADGTRYGLSAAVYTRDADRLATAPGRLRAGVVALNRRGDDVELEAPFLGRKHSGNGYAEGGAYAYDAVTDLQAVYG